MNKDNHIGVRTNFGLTERENIHDIVQQGGIFGPTKCSVSTDSLGRNVITRKESYYRYKDNVNIIPLTYIDDIGAASRCGETSMKLNSYITTNIEAKKLKCNEKTVEQKEKCFKMHVGSKKSS